HHDGRGPGRVHAELDRARVARGGDDPEGHALHGVLAHHLPAHPAGRGDRPGAGLPQCHGRFRHRGHDRRQQARTALQPGAAVLRKLADPRRLGGRRAADDLHAGGRRGRLARRRHSPPRSRTMIGWRTRLNLTGWILGTLTVVFLTYQWLPILTLGLLSFSGPTGGTTFPMNGTSLHWYEELWRATVMNDFKPPLWRSTALALACSATTIVLSTMAAQAMRGRFR